MATWSRDKVDSTQLNSGNEFDTNSQFALDEMNAIVNGGLYSQDFAEHLADTPDNSLANQVGTSEVEIIDNVVGGKTYKKFKFKNLKGETGYQILRATTILQTTSTSVNKSYLATPATPKISDTLLDSSGLVFAVTGFNDPLINISYRYSIIGETGTVSQTETIINSVGYVSQELSPNVFYNFTGNLTSLTITFGTAINGKINEYDFQFVSGSSAPTISVPSGVNWVDNGVYIQNIQPNKTYQVSILNNLGIIVCV